MTNPTPPFMSTAELAAYLGVSRTFILHNRDTHPLFSKAVKIGRPNAPLKWFRTDVDAYLETLKQEAP